MPSQVQEHLTRWLQSTSGHVESVTRAGLEPPLAEARGSMQGIATAADQTVRTLQLTRRDMTSIVRWVWIGAGVSLLCALVALIGTYKMLYGDYATRYDALRTQLNYMEAINRSDIVPCGDGRLCVNIDDKAPKLYEPSVCFFACSSRGDRECDAMCTKTKPLQLRRVIPRRQVVIVPGEIGRVAQWVCHAQTLPGPIAGSAAGLGKDRGFSRHLYQRIDT